MRSTPKKTLTQIIGSGNHYLAAIKGNHEHFFQAIQQHFTTESLSTTIERSHGRLERRSVSLWQTLDGLPQKAEWAGLKSILRVTSYRHRLKGGYILIGKPSTRYYISSVDESVEAFGQRIRNYWHVENKVHYVRDVTQKEDASRIRVHPLPNILAVARNFTLNLFREQGLENMAQAQRRAGFGLDFLKSLFRMK
jgi:predicted transposase YbfD/YdcC